MWLIPMEMVRESLNELLTLSAYARGYSNSIRFVCVCVCVYVCLLLAYCFHCCLRCPWTAQTAFKWKFKGFQLGDFTENVSFVSYGMICLL